MMSADDVVLFLRTKSWYYVCRTTLIIMAAYTKMFLVVRQQVSSMPTDILGSFGSTTIFGSSVRKAKNLFVMCAAYYLTYLPVVPRLALRAGGLKLPDVVAFVFSWIYRSSGALNGILYIALHSSVRNELRRYLPRGRRATVAPTSSRVVGDGGSHRYVNTGTAPDAPVAALTSSSQRVTIHYQKSLSFSNTVLRRL